MSHLPVDFLEDRKLRDAARRVITTDVAQLKGSLAEQGVMSRFANTVIGTVRRRIGEGARDVTEFAQDQVKARPGMLAGLGAAILGALAVWFIRRPSASASELDRIPVQPAALPPHETPFVEAAAPLSCSDMGEPYSP